MSLLRSAGRVACASSVQGRVQRRQSARGAVQEGAAKAGPPPSSLGGLIAASHPAGPASASTEQLNVSVPIPREQRIVWNSSSCSANSETRAS